MFGGYKDRVFLWGANYGRSRAVVARGARGLLGILSLRDFHSHPLLGEALAFLHIVGRMYVVADRLSHHRW